MRDEIRRQDAALQADVSCMRALQSKAAALVSQVQDQRIVPMPNKSVSVGWANGKISEQ